MELALFAAAAVVLTVEARRHPARPTAPADSYTAWLLRQQKPALHR